MRSYYIIRDGERVKVDAQIIRWRRARMKAKKKARLAKAKADAAVPVAVKLKGLFE